MELLKNQKAFEVEVRKRVAIASEVEDRKLWEHAVEIKVRVEAELKRRMMETEVNARVEVELETAVEVKKRVEEELRKLPMIGR